MKRTAVAALAAVTVLTLPAAPASACSPARPTIDVDRTQVVAGEDVGVSGEEIVDRNGKAIPFTCDMTPPLPSPTEEPSATPEPTASASGDPGIGPSPSPPLVTLPPLVPVAYTPPASPLTMVRVTIAEYRDWDEPAATPRELAVFAPKPKRPWKDDLWSLSFGARVTIPADLRPGRYVLHAAQVKGIYFGEADITVVDGLAATGAPAADLVRVALLSLLTGAGALVAGRRRGAYDG